MSLRWRGLPPRQPWCNPSRSTTWWRHRPRWFIQHRHRHRPSPVPGSQVDVPPPEEDICSTTHSSSFADQILQSTRSGLQDVPILIEPSDKAPTSPSSDASETAPAGPAAADIQSVMEPGQAPGSPASAATPAAFAPEPGRRKALRSGASSRPLSVDARPPSSEAPSAVPAGPTSALSIATLSPTGTSTPAKDWPPLRTVERRWRLAFPIHPIALSLVAFCSLWATAFSYTSGRLLFRLMPRFGARLVLMALDPQSRLHGLLNGPPNPRTERLMAHPVVSRVKAIGQRALARLTASPAASRLKAAGKHVAVFALGYIPVCFVVGMIDGIVETGSEAAGVLHQFLNEAYPNRTLHEIASRIIVAVHRRFATVLSKAGRNVSQALHGVGDAIVREGRRELAGTARDVSEGLNTARDAISDTFGRTYSDVVVESASTLVAGLTKMGPSVLATGALTTTGLWFLRVVSNRYHGKLARAAADTLHRQRKDALVKATVVSAAAVGAYALTKSITNRLTPLPAADSPPPRTLTDDAAPSASSPIRHLWIVPLATIVTLALTITL
ncbi:unnamed protein product (mitochondrion) [Plasmodiophora brassicae]|uniref:Uncharacterized protein n=2 Tax=Plasmodiophora brassicae TaxID=37360 RepID=A0A3P3YBB6_PLABS|nr:unnamed protein product [Plasmodiophora brassicae]